MLVNPGRFPRWFEDGSLTEGRKGGGADEGVEGKGLPPRFFTQRECCRLMGFPEWFESISAFSGFSLPPSNPPSLSPARLPLPPSLPLARPPALPLSCCTRSTSPTCCRPPPKCEEPALILAHARSHGPLQPEQAPESIRFYHMIGNAVAPPVVEAIARQMLAAGLISK